MSLSRRSLFLGSAAFLAAPSIVRASALMPLGNVQFERINHYSITATGPDGPPIFDGAHEHDERHWYRWQQSISGWFRNYSEAVEAMHMLPGASVVGCAVTDTKLVIAQKLAPPAL